VAHASLANSSDRARTLYIVTYAAADAAPLSPIAVPSPDAGRIVRGREPGRIRSMAFEVETPVVPKGASFFVQQADVKA
ncbi:MAG: phytanoyl-CoA dioxygenase family protein, partial [Pikeienuella sp.]